ncbi:MAG: domain containing protein [Bacteroidetes bacterium]|jgi:gliding motility-associated-like protein|nr:domain containing protein [Bacteroidota bacterium]
MRVFLYIALFALFSLNMKATHIVGGELNYRHLGNFDYELKLTVYRDCYTGVPPFDNPASIGIFNQNNAFVQQVLVPFVSLDTLPGLINDPCTIVPTDFCYEVTTYITIVHLPPIPGGYQLAYQRCCRNQSILNLVNPLAAGATYYAHIPDTALVISDSNPKFNNWPPPFICLNKKLIFDHSATDYDGDSLVYSLYNPFHGADYNDPQPQPPYNPPYTSVVWQAPYSQSNMLGGVPLSINSQTGLLTATPGTLGLFVIGIKVSEYRNGVLIGETYRDFQFIVKPCTNVVVAAAIAPNVICGEPTVNFVNHSQGASSYLWNFGDPTTGSDVTTVSAPDYTYPAAGTYTATLIAYAPPALPQCNDTASSVVTIEHAFSTDFTLEPFACNTSKIHFTAHSVNPTSLPTHYLWNLGDGSQSNLPEFDYEYQSSGNFVITLVSNAVGGVNCSDTVSSQSIYISPKTALFVPNTFSPNGDGNNDVFRARGPLLNFFYLAVYNRWGEKVFDTDNINNGWNGTYHNMASDPGVYGYYMKASCDGVEFTEEKGNVTLIR